MSKNIHVETQARRPSICIEYSTRFCSSHPWEFVASTTWKRPQQIVPRASKPYFRIRKEQRCRHGKVLFELEVSGVSKTLSDVRLYQIKP